MNYSALIGSITKHSKSHLLFSILESQFCVEHSHIKIDVSESNLENVINCLKELNFSFVNVTFPYKIKCIDYLDSLSEECSIMKSVNTIKFIDNKKIGYNVDGIAAVDSIRYKLKDILSTDRVLLFGAGGDARSIIYELLKFTDNIVVINHDKNENKELKKIYSNIEIYDFDIDFVEKINNSDFIINATSVGNDNQNECVISKSVWNKINNLNNKYFFDVILNPTETLFLSRAKEKNAKICSGLYMMIFQLVDLFCETNNVDRSKINIEDLYQQLK